MNNWQSRYSMVSPGKRDHALDQVADLAGSP